MERRDTAASLEMLLHRALQIEIHTASDYFAASVAIKQSKVDLLIVDLGGAQAPGTNLIRELRANLRHRFTPVIAITTACYDDTKPAAAYKAGANVVMYMPISIDDLNSEATKLLKLSTDPDLSLVYTGVETQGFDYKEAIHLDTKEGCASLAKDVIAMANWGGGTIVIGFKESPPGEFSPVGVPATELDLFEPTRLNKSISDFLDPPVCVRVRRVTDGTFTFVVLNVPGTIDCLILVRKDCAAAGLYKGRIYSRTARMESAQLESADEIRRLIGRLYSQAGKETEDMAPRSS